MNSGYIWTRTLRSIRSTTSLHLQHSQGFLNFLSFKSLLFQITRRHHYETTQRKGYRQTHLDETLADVHPLELDEGFHFLVKDGSTVWIRPEDGRWRRGTVLYESIMEFDNTGVIRQFFVEYGKGPNKKTEIFQPLWGNMKPDTPEVHELLRRNGYFV